METRFTPQQEEFRQRASTFIDSRVGMDMDGQLDFMRDFWSQLGYQMPDPPPRILNYLEEMEPHHPIKRVRPVPVLDPADPARVLDKRRAYVKKAQEVFPANHFTTDPNILNFTGDTPLLIPPTPATAVDGSDYARLIRQPDRRYWSAVLGYRTPEAKVIALTAAVYLSSLRQANQLVLSADNHEWIFPLADVSTTRPATRFTGRPHLLHPTHLTRPQKVWDFSTRQVPSLLTVDGAIATQLIHQAAGVYCETPEYVNETVFMLPEGTEQGYIKRSLAPLAAIKSIATVGWNAAYGCIEWGSAYEPAEMTIGQEANLYPHPYVLESPIGVNYLRNLRLKTLRPSKIEHYQRPSIEI